MIQSQERPTNQVSRNGKLYVRYAIKKVVNEDVTAWQYKEKEFPIGTNEEVINNTISKLVIIELANNGFDADMVKAELERKNEIAYYQKLRAEYEELYQPEIREYTEEEKLAHDTEYYTEIEQVEVEVEEGTEPALDEEGNVIVGYKDILVEKTRVIERPKGYVYPKVMTPAAMTFEEYKNETRVVTEAVYYTYEEYINTRVLSAYGEGYKVPTREEYEKNKDNYILSIKEFQKTELVRPYEPKEITDEDINKALKDIGIDYVYFRKKEYPSIEEQLDILYHGGQEEWYKIITDIKNKYPKE
jgi:signal recognition particle subunit SEC65